MTIVTVVASCVAVCASFGAIVAHIRARRAWDHTARAWERVANNAAETLRLMQVSRTYSPVTTHSGRTVAETTKTPRSKQQAGT